MPRRAISERFARLAKEERRFLGTPFLAPVVSGGEVCVRMAGVVLRMQIQPADFRGWGVFQPASTTQATYLRPTTLTERQRYLDLFPKVRLLLCERRSVGSHESFWHAATAHRGDNRFHFQGAVPVRMVEDAEAFDVIQARFDGGNFWFEAIDPTRDLATAAYLRESLQNKVPPADLFRSGLTPEEREAYADRWQALQTISKPVPTDPMEARLRSALAHAGADFMGYVERADGFRVTYRVGGRRMVTSVDKHDFSVQVAGICLSGEDQKFDLGSLVGVLREGGDNTVAIGQDNQGMPEDSYWSIYRR